MGPILPYLPLIAAVAGFAAAIAAGVFNLLNPIFQSNRDHSRATGLVLCDLLSIRSYWGMLVHLPGMIVVEWGFPAESQPLFYEFITQAMPPIETAPEFAEHLRAISPGDPLLAFELQYANLPAAPFLQRMRSLVGDAPVDRLAFRAVESTMSELGIPALEEAIRKVAWSHGIVTWLRTNWYLWRNPLGRLDPKSKQAFADMKAKMPLILQSNGQHLHNQDQDHGSSTVPAALPPTPTQRPPNPPIASDPPC
jgi:hypothetical protein